MMTRRMITVTMVSSKESEVVQPCRHRVRSHQHGEQHDIAEHGEEGRQPRGGQEASVETLAQGAECVVNHRWLLWRLAQVSSSAPDGAGEIP